MTALERNSAESTRGKLRKQPRKHVMTIDHTTFSSSEEEGAQEHETSKSKPVISIPVVSFACEVAMYEVSKLSESNTIYIEREQVCLGREEEKKKNKPRVCKGYQDVPPKEKEKLRYKRPEATDEKALLGLEISLLQQNTLPFLGARRRFLS